MSKFSRNIAGTFGTRIVAAIINLAIAIMLSRFLGPEGKGEQSLIITTITFILVFANIIGGATLVYLSPRHDHASLILPSYLWTILAGIISYPALRILHLVDAAYILHTCILAVLYSLISIHNSLLIGREKIGMSNVISLAQPMLLITGLFIYFGVWKQQNIDAYIASLYFSFGITYLVCVLFQFRVSGRLSFQSLNKVIPVVKEMLRLGIYNQTAHITQMLSFRLSYYVLDLYHGEAAVGVYSNGVSLAESIWLIAKSISMVQYARIANTEDPGESRRLTMRLSRGSFMMSLLIIVPLLIFPKSFYVAVFGPGFEGVKPVIWALSFGVMIYNYAILLGHYFSGTGRYRINALVSSAGLVISAALYFLLIPDYGTIGAGLGSSLSYLLTSIMLVLILRKDQKDITRQILPTMNDFRYFRKELTSLVRGR